MTANTNEIRKHCKERIWSAPFRPCVPRGHGFNTRPQAGAEISGCCHVKCGDIFNFYSVSSYLPLNQKVRGWREIRCMWESRNSLRRHIAKHKMKTQNSRCYYVTLSNVIFLVILSLLIDQRFVKSIKRSVSEVPEARKSNPFCCLAPNLYQKWLTDVKWRRTDRTL